MFTVTVDNASFNDNMQKVHKRQLRKDMVCSGEFFHIRCAAIWRYLQHTKNHLLDVILEHSLYKCKDFCKQKKNWFYKPKVELANISES